MACGARASLKSERRSSLNRDGGNSPGLCFFWNSCHAKLGRLAFLDRAHCALSNKPGENGRAGSAVGRLLILRAALTRKSERRSFHIWAVMRATGRRAQFRREGTA